MLVFLPLSSRASPAGECEVDALFLTANHTIVDWGERAGAGEHILQLFLLLSKRMIMEKVSIFISFSLQASNRLCTDGAAEQFSEFIDFLEAFAWISQHSLLVCWILLRFLTSSDCLFDWGIIKDLKVFLNCCEWWIIRKNLQATIALDELGNNF